jgi:hypothetical protein
MMSALSILEITTYSLALWLGLYLIARNPADPRLWWAGLGSVAYALSLATDLLAVEAATPAQALTMVRLHWPMLFLPAFFWFGAMVYLLPEEGQLRSRLGQIGIYSLFLIAIPFYVVSAGTNLIFDFSMQPPRPGSAYLVFAGAVLLPMLIALILVGRAFRSTRHKQPLGLLLAATLFFSLSTGLLIFPLDWLPRSWLLIGTTLDLIILGVAIALLDAFEEGETLLPDLARSFDSAFFAVLIFGGLVVLTMNLGTGASFPMLGLLLATIAAAIAIQTFADPIQAAIDHVTFATFPQLRQARAELRAAASALPRANPALDPAQIDEDAFARLTRRALSHLGDLPRLATSPLTRLPLIETRLAQREQKDNTLERAAELKRLLTESITRLKPLDKGDFGSSEEWRYYNALYFPYVVGLKPYSRRAEYNGLDPTEQEALDWFRTYVPERTLYNWQNAAARLVAQDLRERQRAVNNGKLSL